MSFLVNDVFPAGVVLPYAGTTAPTGWVLCDGSAIDRNQYQRLFNAISTTYGNGNGSSTFNLPDLRGRTPAGKDDMGGAAANRLSTVVAGATLGAVGGAETHTLSTPQLPVHAHGQQGAFNTGNQSSDHSHNFGTGGQSVLHAHSYNVPINGSRVQGGNDNGAFYDQNSTGSTTGINNADHSHGGTTAGMNSSHFHGITLSGNTTDTGNNNSHNNTQPTIILNYIIKL
jgi:microcystin-dependent protein